MEYLTGPEKDEPESESVRRVTRAAARLSPADRREILRFVRFLRSRSRDEPAS